MPYPIERKFVVALASSALFDLGEADRIFREEGPEAYRKYQEQHLDDTLNTGVAFPFVKRLLRLNTVFSETQPVEVVLLSRNSPESGLRVFRSIQYHGLGITRASFLSGIAPHLYLDAFNATIFLSANAEDVRSAIRDGRPAGLVINSDYIDDGDPELRLAFDFDSVLADDASEKVNTEKGLDYFHAHEQEHRDEPLNPGPLKPFIDKISYFQKLEAKKAKDDQNYRRILHTSIVTARNAPSHERMVNTLKDWGIFVDSAFFLGGIEKRRILEVYKPHLFFDDQVDHLTSTKVPQVHIPFGIANLKPQALPIPLAGSTPAPAHQVVCDVAPAST